MDLGLEGRLVLVTGGSKGIGLACARAFAADLTDPTAAAALVEAVEARLGPVDVLVNSAGAARQLPPEELTPAGWRAAMDGKFFTTINVLDPLVKRMAGRGRGVIVNIIGSGGRVASPVHLAGGAANAALMLATAGLGAAYAARGVRVVGINPGLTETGRVATRLAAEAQVMGITVAEARERTVAGIPMGRLAEPEEIGQMAVFLASDKAGYVTGVTVTMDGARSPVIL